ncbi:putative nucleotide-binding alpha-beta plait domain-containing protein [Rosa chinensis]|uniref:Putative nucleotide-binding alpha-beta plait domain-containing protein n=1 Tax=Rosa chinensis TaxID=74649 RepID=A0A2P6PRG4_ROSCH|nr:cleavage stimulating factor 64 [Rosa chinensis]PRQ24527.1 putative nucleotide-binding alpha-beta plait domain-containing protein [Rosa chinensis]
MASSQHRCVFVGNIPYDATEEQLIEICQEVGPVVSFRLVIDRETGKPKGYGFCEYKDEETALSARRNLQGYEINGRQLRVDFAENDKGTDRNREQGRGGPGVTANVDPPKQVGGAAVHGDSLHNQPIGLHIAITAAAVMAGALGGPQAVLQSNQNGLQNQSALANDPLTLHLAKMSRSQLTQIISEVKGMAIQNKELAHKLFVARPQLPKALFQAQIMLGMVTPQMLQMANIRQASGQSSQPLFNQGQQVPSPAVQNLADLAPSAENRLMPKMQDGPFSAVPQNLLVHSQFSAPRQQNMQPRMQLSQHANHNVLQHGTLLGQAGIPTLPPMHPQSSSGLSIRSQTQVANSSVLNQKMQPPLLQHPGQVGPSHLGHNTPMVHQNATVQQSPLSRPFSDAIFQPGPSISKGVLQSINKDADRSSRVVADSSESVNRPSKLLKLDDGRSTPLMTGGLNVSNANESALPNVYGAGLLPGKPVHKSEDMYSEKQISEPQIPPEVDSALLQQVLSLPPEKLSLLSPEQRQEVIKLQQRFRREQIQPS